jgi:ribonuclease HI
VQHFVFNIGIRSHQDSNLCFELNQNNEIIEGQYHFEQNAFSFNSTSKFTEVFEENKLQFLKILRSAYRGNVTTDTQITGIIIPGFPFLENSAYDKVICFPNYSHPMLIEGKQQAEQATPGIVCDGSFNSLGNIAAYAGIVSTPNKGDEVYSGKLPKCSSNQAELIAVIEGVKRLQQYAKFQINTDSRFVIKGLIQWVHFWKLNNWQTAFGTPVKFTSQWQELYQLCQNKSLEIQWIKGHAGDPLHTYCHKLAHQLATE